MDTLAVALDAVQLALASLVLTEPARVPGSEHWQEARRHLAAARESIERAQLARGPGPDEPGTGGTAPRD